MAQINREQLLKKPFTDFRHYPYGFSRSGDFSIVESDALTRYGFLITGLLQGELVPVGPEEQRLLQVALGTQAPESVVEKAWMKYQQRLNRPRVGSMYGRCRPVQDDYSGAGTEDDLVIEE